MGAQINTGMADVVIFSKPIEGDEETANKAKADGAKIIVDFCDNHLDTPIYQKMAGLADIITCPSKVMQAEIAKLGFDSTIIADPYEFDIQTPHVNGQNMMWFGHQSNLLEITPYLQMPIEVVTGPNKYVKTCTFWSIENVRDALSRNDIVLIPDGKPTRSNNRMVNAIAAGCFVMGGKQLGEWKRFVYSGPLHHGFQFSKCFQSELNGMVKEGQDYIVKHHSPEVVAKQWKDVCESI
tara:strand:+ start:3602 stop:4315 length:714 start_codon:yes stop_codon:yes gene_type:complete